MAPVWLCPLQLRPPAAGSAAGAVDAPAVPWPLYPMRMGELYVNVGFWGTVSIEAGRVDGDVNRAVEAAVAERDGHKSLYSDAYYDRDTFAAIYGGAVYSALKKRYDPDQRLTGMYEKAVGRR
jgi:FAD/FMN-containing dehydrogenase